MKQPLDNWFTIKRGYTFGVPTFYNDFHLGTDYIVPIGTPIFAPADGEITFVGYGAQGGNTLWFAFNGLVMRCLHLTSWKPRGFYRKGDIIGYTGNTGLSTAPHVHVDLSMGKVDLDNTSNFIDPAVYFMGNTQNVLCVLNDPAQKTFIKKAVDNAVAWFGSLGFNLHTDMLISDYPFTGELYADGHVYVNVSQILEVGRQAESSFGKQFDVISLLHNPDKITPKPTNPMHVAVFQDGFTSIQNNVSITAEQDVVTEFFIHELLHSWYSIINREGNLALVDDVHQHGGWQVTGPGTFSEIVNNLKPHWHYLATDTHGENTMLDFKKGDSGNPKENIYMIDKAGVARPFLEPKIYKVFEPFGTLKIIPQIQMDAFPKGQAIGLVEAD